MIALWEEGGNATVAVAGQINTGDGRQWRDSQQTVPQQLTGASSFVPEEAKNGGDDGLERIVAEARTATTEVGAYGAHEESAAGVSPFDSPTGGGSSAAGVAVAAGGGGAIAVVGGVGVGSGSPCRACKFLRRKCISGCLFAPYFDAEQGAAHFAAVHKVFGASNVSKLLLNIPADKRLDDVVTIRYEAEAQLRDPVYGCVAHIFALQQQVAHLQAELSYLRAHLATTELPPPPPPPQPSGPPSSPPFSTSELPSSASSLPPSFDLSTLLDDPVHPRRSQQQQQQEQLMELRRLCGAGDGSLTGTTSGSGGLQALTRGYVDERRSASVETSLSITK